MGWFVLVKLDTHIQTGDTDYKIKHGGSMSLKGIAWNDVNLEFSAGTDTASAHKLMRFLCVGRERTSKKSWGTFHSCLESFKILQNYHHELDSSSFWKSWGILWQTTFSLGSMFTWMASGLAQRLTILTFSPHVIFQQMMLLLHPPGCICNRLSRFVDISTNRV